MDMTDELKTMIKNVNDGNMIGTKETFDTLIANKIYDRIQDKKEEMAKTMFNKEHESPESTVEPETANEQE